MKVVQLLPTLSFGDGVGNDALALKEIIAGLGYETAIYAENIDKRLPEGSAIKADKLTDLKSSDVLIYHKSTGTDLSFKIDSYKCRRVMIYHNITPPDFFRPYSPSATQLTVLSGLPDSKAASYESPHIISATPFRYLWLRVDSSTSGSNWVALAELSVTEVLTVISDPEKE